MLEDARIPGELRNVTIRTTTFVRIQQPIF